MEILRNINILVEGEDDDIRITVLLDWEQAGWRPEYWEAYKFVVAAAGRGDWVHLGRRQAVPNYDTEIERERQRVVISGIL